MTADSTRAAAGASGLVGRRRRRAASSSSHLAVVPDTIEPVWADRESGQASVAESGRRTTGPAPEVSGESTTGPTEQTRVPPDRDPILELFDRIWHASIESLARRLGTDPTVTLCMPDGRPLAAYGVVEGNLDPIIRSTCELVAASRNLASAHHRALDQVEILQSSGGRSHTVVCGAPVTGHGILLLTVTAEDVSPSAMVVQARTTANHLVTVLSATG